MSINMHDTISRICKSLFTAEERRLDKVKDDLVAQNKELYRDRPHDGFTYQGKPYDPTGLGLGRRTRVPLHLSLAPQMDVYLRDHEQVWGDRYYISQVLVTILRPCSDLQDVRDALPNCIVDTLEELRPYSRSRDEAYTIMTDARTVRQYKKVLARIEFYATTRLLY